MNGVPMAAADVRFFGEDRNLNGIPDALEGGGASFGQYPQEPVARTPVTPQYFQEPVVRTPVTPQYLQEPVVRTPVTPQYLQERVVYTPPRLVQPAANVRVVGAPLLYAPAVPVVQYGQRFPVAAGAAPMATANVKVVGEDWDRNGIPDAMEGKGGRVRIVPARSKRHCC
jgi:hypothetical protein